MLECIISYLLLVEYSRLDKGNLRETLGSTPELNYMTQFVFCCLKMAKYQWTAARTVTKLSYTSALELREGKKSSLLEKVSVVLDWILRRMSSR